MNRKLLFKAILFITFSSFLLLGCGEEDETPSVKFLVDSQSIITRSSGELKTFLQVGQINFDLNALKYNVEVFKVSYKSHYKGNEIIASGLVILPQTTDPVGMISFQHGTITAHSEAPSAQPPSDGTMILYAGLASPGFIGVVPDFFGFGSSTEILHPYYVEDATAQSVIDLLKAAKELASMEGIKFNEKLFLAGYSQGGYATMATHKYIEEEGLKGFNLIASFPASGGYDIKEMQNYFFGLTNYDNPYYMAYVAEAYKTHYEWNNPLSEFFSEPYATRIPNLFDGLNNSSDINAQLTFSIQDLITEDIRLNIDTDSKFDYITNAFKENSLVDWIPHTKIFMYHGDADITVPYDNSVITYNKLIANGASTSIVTFTNLPGKTHGTGVVPYVEAFVGKLLELK